MTSYYLQSILNVKRALCILLLRNDVAMARIMTMNKNKKAILCGYIILLLLANVVDNITYLILSATRLRLLK